MTDVSNTATGDDQDVEMTDVSNTEDGQGSAGWNNPQIFTAFVPPATLSDTAPAPGTTDQTLEQARQRAAQAHADLVRFETELETQRTRNNWNETHPDYQNGLHRAAQLRQEAARADHDLNTLQARTTNTTPPTTTGHDLFAFPVFDIQIRTVAQENREQVFAMFEEYRDHAREAEERYATARGHARGALEALGAVPHRYAPANHQVPHPDDPPNTRRVFDELTGAHESLALLETLHGLVRDNGYDTAEATLEREIGEERQRIRELLAHYRSVSGRFAADQPFSRQDEQSDSAWPESPDAIGRMEQHLNEMVAAFEEAGESWLAAEVAVGMGDSQISDLLSELNVTPPDADPGFSPPGDDAEDGERAAFENLSNSRQSLARLRTLLTLLRPDGQDATASANAHPDLGGHGTDTEIALLRARIDREERNEAHWSSVYQNFGMDDDAMSDTSDVSTVPTVILERPSAPPALTTLQETADIIRANLPPAQNDPDRIRDALAEIDALIERARPASQDLPPDQARAWELGAAMVRDYSRFALQHLSAATDSADHRNRLGNAIREVLAAPESASPDNGRALLRDYLDHARQLAELLGYTSLELVEGNADLAPPISRIRHAYTRVAESARTWHTLDARLRAAGAVRTETTGLHSGRDLEHQRLERRRRTLNERFTVIRRSGDRFKQNNDQIAEVQERADAAWRESQDFLALAEEQRRLAEAYQEELADLENTTDTDDDRTTATPDYDTLIDEAREQATELRDQARNHATEADHTLASLARAQAQLTDTPETDTATRNGLLWVVQRLESHHAHLRGQARALHARADYHQAREQALTRQRDTAPADTVPDRDQQTTILRDRLQAATERAGRYFTRAEQLRDEYDTLTAQIQTARDRSEQAAAHLARALDVTAADPLSLDAATELRDLRNVELSRRQTVRDLLEYWQSRVFELSDGPVGDRHRSWSLSVARANVEFLERRLEQSRHITNAYTQLVAHILSPMTGHDAISMFLNPPTAEPRRRVDAPPAYSPPPAYPTGESVPTRESTAVEQRGRFLARTRHTIDLLRQRIAALGPEATRRQRVELDARLDYYTRNYHHHARIQAQALGTAPTRPEPQTPPFDLESLPPEQHLH
ncbi:hypothetical protein, partial [Thermobifida halotolerans]